MPDAQQLAQQILDSVGGSANIADVENCMTRLRVEVVSDSSVALEDLKATDGVMAAIAAGSNLQIVLGPGLVDRVADGLEALRATAPSAAAGGPGASPDELAARGASIKATARARSDGRTMRAIRKISAIFIPLIPALIACGLIAGINGILTNLGWLPGVTPFLGVLSSGFLSLLAVFVGMAVLSKSVSRWSSAARPSSVVRSAASSSRPASRTSRCSARPWLPGRAVCSAHWPVASSPPTSSGSCGA
ncbi:PTS transporter subunit EIIB [Curtobacterium flaccumfaciens]|nr:PTS transporter subunit EIIB [Curtobacterium flaccumfaciens]MCS6577346.1 PTS transporter subunit EIIB [Curtobacterium flaccumfaciens]